MTQAHLQQIGTNHICLGSGASDILDLIIRVTCIPSRDKILVTPPAFELYRVCATLHDVGIQECQQEYTPEGGFRLPIEEVEKASISCVSATNVTDLHHVSFGQDDQGRSSRVPGQSYGNFNPTNRDPADLGSRRSVVFYPIRALSRR